MEGNPINFPKYIIDYYFPETTGYPEENKMLYFDYRGIRRMLARGNVQNYQVSKAPDKLFKTRYIVSGKVQKVRSEEHTSELQSRGHLVCRLLLEKKKI